MRFENTGPDKHTILLLTTSSCNSDFPECCLWLIVMNILLLNLQFMNFRVSFELEPGALGQTTDFKEANKRLEWALKKVPLFLVLL